ncbi:gephyrin-like molybdotransferase Glp [Noviherbaspirillum denitrificans]|uniref:Molybdopterin molybdenumtransferase n=1 Tax=Noviherbaspirillum denitrificans TaxID=1968433 RepID=A0A254TN95_9BURK|nr:gephyrin-like molybdotransferase Glp [Noviherbaspirillum denitrificans]OWW22093.1 molybdenum cofactor biosynthesis protein MoaA [Noviherbaspirillum denitrificans]
MTKLADIAQEIAGFNPDALEVGQAQELIRAFVAPVDGDERQTLTAALGRVLAEDVISPIDVPAHDNSAMDGFAFLSKALGHEDVTLKVTGTAFAGHPFSGTVSEGECVRIMTGAVMPAGCDTVIPIELVKNLTESTVTIAAGSAKAGDNRRLQGEDLAAGTPALRMGKILRPADLGLLASLGIGEVPVKRRLRVAFFSTGDELRSIGEVLEEGCIYDSNRYTVYGMLSRMGCEVIDMGVVRDDPASLESALRSACESADAIVTSGGVSAGDADYTKAMMEKLGDVHFWKLAMRPGRPMAFGRITSNGTSAFLFGLPGNPVAAMVSFYFFAREALLRMMGAQSVALPRVRVTLQSTIRKKPGRTEYQRGILSLDADGKPEVRVTGSQGSGILRSMSEANCMIVVPHAQGNVHPGEAVDVVLFEGLT